MDLRTILTVMLAGCLCSFAAQAATYTWTGATGVSGNWGVAADWGGTNFPGNSGNSGSDTATFNFGTVANPIVNMDAPYGVSAVTLTGNGTLTLNGASTNPLSISAPSGITVGSGQTLNGNGTLNAPVELWGGTLGGTLTTGAVNSVGGTLAPGVYGTSYGILAINGGLTADSGTTFNYLLNGNATPGTTYDQITATGTLALAGTLNMWDPGYGMAAGQQYVIMTCAGGSTPTGSLTWGYSTGTTGSYNCTLTYSAGQVILTTYASSTDRTFTWAPSSDSNWGTAGNWTGGGPVMGAQSQDAALFNLGASPLVVNMEASHSIPKISLSGSGTLTVNGSGVLSVPNGITVGSGQTLNGNGTISCPNTTFGIGPGPGGLISGNLAIQGQMFIQGNVNGSHVITVPNNSIYGVYIEAGGVFDGTNTIYSPMVVVNPSGGAATFQGTNTIYTPLIDVCTPSSSSSSALATFTGVNYVYGLTSGIYTQSPGNYTKAGGTISGSGELDGNVYDYFGNYNGTYLITGSVTVGNTAYAALIGAVASNFAGPSQINGSVYLGGKSSGTAQAGAAIVTFTGGNTIGQNLTVSNVAGSNTHTSTTISPHNGLTGIGTLTVGQNMTLDAYTTLNFDLGAPDSPNPLGTNNDYISVGNNLTLAGTLNVAAVPGFIGGTTYTLITYGGTETGTLTLGTMPLSALYTYGLTYTGGNVNLTSAKSASAITWNDSVPSGNWTAPGSWTNAVAPTGGNGVFLSGAGSYAINVDTASAVNAIGVTDNGVWSISGNAITLGSGGLTYLSTGSSTISAPLGGTGGLTVYNGNLTLGGATAHGYTGATDVGTNGTLTVNGTVSGTSSVTINNSATLNGGVAGSIPTAPIALLAGGTLGGSLTVGGNITVTGGGTTANAPTISGSPVINGSLALASNILNVSGMVSMNGSVPSAGCGTWTSGGTVNNTGTIGNAINLTGGGTLQGTGTYAGAVTMTGSSGTGATITGSPTFTGNVGFSGTNQTLTVPSTGTVSMNGPVPSTGCGTWTVPTGDSVFNNGTVGNAISLTGGTLGGQGGGSGTYAGLVTATGGTITGNGSFTGGLTTSGGTIITPNSGLSLITTINAGTVSATGTQFNFDLGAANNSDLLAVTGTAVLGARLPRPWTFLTCRRESTPIPSAPPPAARRTYRAFRGALPRTHT